MLGLPFEARFLTGWFLHTTRNAEPGSVSANVADMRMDRGRASPRENRQDYSEEDLTHLFRELGENRRREASQA